MLKSKDKRRGCHSCLWLRVQVKMIQETNRLFQYTEWSSTLLYKKGTRGLQCWQKNLHFQSSFLNSPYARMKFCLWNSQKKKTNKKNPERQKTKQLQRDDCERCSLLLIDGTSAGPTPAHTQRDASVTITFLIASKKNNVGESCQLILLWHFCTVCEISRLW